MELTASELWSRILESAKTGLPEQAFRAWLDGITAVALSEDELILEAPSRFHAEWVEDRFGDILDECARRALGRPLRITLQSGSPQPIQGIPAVKKPEGEGARFVPPRRTPSGDAPSIGGPGLSRRYTFERFVVGNSNELAAAACRAVAEKPARTYNPLFLYGGVGLGKTHLMQAIGSHLLERNAARRVAYLPTEQFTNELVTAIQEGTTPEFRRRYRRMDLLLVDDVHFLQRKERTQEEFFHTFNALYDAQCQIVLTSDRPPKEIPRLEDRLVSRFEWGLVADINPPDYETRVAILRKKAADEKLTLDLEVIDFIAVSCTSSVRELEGAVIKLLAYSSVRKEETNIEVARRALQGMIGPEGERGRRTVTPEGIVLVVAGEWETTPKHLGSKRRTRNLTVPRQVAMYLIKELLDLPLVRIGELFGGRDHSTVIHSLRRVEQRSRSDPDFRRRVLGVRRQLGEGEIR